MKELLSADENVKWLPKPHRFELWLDNDLPPIEKTASAFVMAFQDENLLLANVFSRGWDIPGGHIEGGETPQEAMTRELFEETGASLLCSSLMGYIKITLEGDKPNPYPYPFPTSYMAFYWGMVDKIDKPSASMEVGEPKLFPQHKIERSSELIHRHRPFYEQALARTQVFLKAMAEAS